MKQVEYQNSDQFKGLLNSITDAIEEKCKIQDDDSLSEDEKAKALAKVSDRIMDVLRSHTLFVNKEYILAAHSNPKATLDPDDVRIKLNLTDDDLVTEWYHICANSFGPFNPTEYFKKGNCRILWLLKESYIMKESWVKGDRGGHNQASDNRIWNTMEENTTIENVIQRTRTLLHEVTGKDYTEQEAMNHICILEVSHFPGPGFNGTDSENETIGKWAKYNVALIKLLISFYAPDIVIGGFTLGHFFPEGYRYDESDKSVGEEKNDHNFDHILNAINKDKGDDKNNERININMFEHLGFTSIPGNENNRNAANSYVFNTMEGCVLIDAYHPSYEPNHTDNNARQYGTIAKQMLESRIKTRP